MPSTAQLRSRLVAKLKELFQLDQPDLDFGFYRIMHAKAKQVTDFLEKDLLKVIEDTFGNQADQQAVNAHAKARQDLEAALGAAALDEDGVLNPAFAATPAGETYLRAIAAADAAKDALSAEGEIYDHLHRFFERYYEEGDFISRRYFNRETAGRAAPFAIPYNGEEVKLHWANADQYYIKTGEYFSNFTVDLSKVAGASSASSSESELGLESQDQPLLLHFRLVDAVEGEHGNVKASDATKRFFILHAEDPIGFNEAGELELRFEYRPDPDKPEKSQEGKWQEELRAQATAKLLELLTGLPLAAAYQRLLSAKVPTEANKDRTLLAKYLHQYTARNTADYFIHKDLGSFLRRELDFYIKNEVMRLDDIENEDAPRVETYLARIKVLRTIARQLIAFVAQLEDFQKKLWLKKKFVVETNYGITLDRIPEELYPEIVANDAQREEWVTLYAIHEIEGKASGDLLKAATPGYSSPLTVEFLKSQPFLVLDTRHFSGEFKARLVASIEGFDEQCDGLLVHSENFQALALVEPRQINQIDCVYVDPPYNTGENDFSYKDGFTHSSWLAMAKDRLTQVLRILKREGQFICHIDEHEHCHLEQLLDNVWPSGGSLGPIIWDKRNPKGDALGISVQHEYIAWAAASSSWVREDRKNLQRNKRNALKIIEKASALIKKSGVVDDDVRREFRRWLQSQDFSGGEIAYCHLDEAGEVYRPVSMAWPNKKRAPDEYFEPLIHPDTKKACPVPERGWRNPPQTMADLRSKGLVLFGPDETTQPNRKYLLSENMTENVPSLLYYGGSDDDLLSNLDLVFPNPKPVEVASYLISIPTRNGKGLILDFFAGSGTTGHGVINLNREDNGKRKYILIEMGDHFDTVLKPRIAKVVYSPDWKDGKPVSRDKGISHCFKYVRLESFEDTLNNLRFTEDAERERALAANDPLRRDYTLNYLLDVETRGSQSLLNLDGFTDPTAYTLKVKKSGASGSVEQPVDLIETFNFLIGLRLVHLAAPQHFTATFQRVPDPDLPKGTDTRLQLDGKMQLAANGGWWFRKVEGWVPKDRENPNNGQKEKVLIVWRNLTGNLEEDNLMLDEWFQKNRLSTRDFEFDTIYVNGSNNLPNLKLDSDTWKVRLLEEEFHKAMWDLQEA